MLKTGIYDVSQLTGTNRFKSVFGRDLVVSVTLYDQILDLPQAEVLAERILRFFTDERGVYKRTCAHRFEDFDANLHRMLVEHFDPQQPLVLADLAVSDGRTACELFERLVPSFPQLAHFASDFSPELWVIQQGRLKVTLSKSGQVLETVWPPFVFNTMNPEHPVVYPLNKVVRFMLKRFWVKPLVAKYQAGQVKARELRVFSVKALNLARQDPRFHLGDQNILERLMVPEPPHVIRAMNILNPSYFSPEKVDRILGNLFASLRLGGWLVIGSNEDAGSVVNGGIYRRTATGFERIWQSGAGPQIEERVLSWKTPGAGDPGGQQGWVPGNSGRDQAASSVVGAV
jgi:hypothetical protein